MGNKVTIIDQRDHIGGNCFDMVIGDTRVHRYGPHIFHTNNKRIFDWLSKFTEWVPYKHKVKALYGNQFLTLPPNNETKRILGDSLIDVIYKPYTKKMWGTVVDDTVLDRVKPRNDDNELYFPNDEYQCLPKHGYTAMFKRILDHENITVQLETRFDRNMEYKYDHVFCSASIDEYYGYVFGVLPYRSIVFKDVDTLPHDMPTSVVNYTDDGVFTRVTAWNQFPNHGNGEFYTLEQPVDFKDNNFERHYPVKDKDGHNKQIYDKYKHIKNNKVTFIGRCGLYVYLDMDMACANALTIVNKYGD